jgi:4-hydroxy-4-methyl-2-oxoglutarate aldolase
MIDAKQRESLEALSTALLSDARSRLGLPESHLDPGIRPVVPFSMMAGTAVTVRLEVAEDPDSADLALMLQTVQTDSPGSVLVVEVPSKLHRYGIVGGGAATRARRSGFVGALVEGAVRDTDDLRDMGFPVFSRTIGPGFIVGMTSVAEVGGPVTVGERAIHPGDVIVADNDGVTVILPEELDTVIARATAIKAWEKRRHGMIAEGRSYEDVARLSGPLP